MNKLKDFLIDLVFPNRCPFCGDVIKWNVLSCDECYGKIPWRKNTDYSMEASGEIGIFSFENKHDGVFVAADYDGIAKDAIVRLKYEIEPNFIKLAAAEIYAKLFDEGLHERIDYVVPVPMGPKKQRKIGYNHSEVIAEELGKTLDVLVRTDLIFKHDSEQAQHTMNAAERAENVKGQYYKSDKTRIDGKTVLLCDDVATTGVTLAECSRLLFELGAETVYKSAVAATR